MTALMINGLVNGVIVGGLYALLGLSLSLLYGVLRVVNFAHGELVIAGSYVAYVLFSTFGLSPLAALPLAAISFFIAGWGAYFVLIPRLSKSDDPETASFLLMYGFSIAMAALLLLIFEADSRSIDYSFDPISIPIGPVNVSTARLVALAVTAVVSAVMTWFLFRTLPGKALRAATMNREAIQIVGVNIERLSAFAFALTFGIAGVTGVLIALVFPAFGPFSGAEYSIIGFIVIVLGGLGNPMGALIAGIFYGIAEQMATVLLAQALAQIVGFGLLVATILVRPTGLFGFRALR